MKIVAIIPCRYNSKRFPGKSLALINGFPIMWHVYNQSMKSKFVQESYIATDDKRIKKKCDELEINCLMTSKKHHNGTERIAECVRKINADIYVNVQGDEPMISPQSIDKVVKGLVNIKDKNILATNAFHLIKEKKEIFDTNVIKTIFDKKLNALAFSRNPIPYSKDTKQNFWRQIGLYAFKKNGLILFSKMKPGPLELIETIEMYRLIENSYKIKMIKVNDVSKSVDNLKDLKEVRRLMKI